jgi:PAS domain S-box-containing protein
MRVKLPSTDLTSLILESLDEGVFTVDANRRITYFNAAAERITGVERAAALGKRCHDVFRASICQSDCALMRTIETGEPSRNVRVTILNAEMEEVPIHVSTVALKNRHGEMIGGVEIFRDVTDVEALRHALAQKHVFQDIIGASRRMQDLFKVLPDVAESDAPVLLQGPSGSGKEMVAQAIVDLSPRRGQPFVRVNCGALPDTLLESELFGHKKGAFTDAWRDKPGRFVQADGGTILLDEIGDTSAAFQVKLLRVLEDGEVQPLGSTVAHKVDVRVMAATNKDLKAAIAAGGFREDLYYRLCVVPLFLPPLRERKKDIPLLAEHFLKVIALKRGKAITGFTGQAFKALYDYHYPGNVRELENLVERAVVLCHESQIDVEHLPDEILLETAKRKTASRDGTTDGDEDSLPPGCLSRRPTTRLILSTPEPPLDPNRLKPEARKLVSVLNAHNWNRKQTARALGISRNTLWRRMKEYGLLRR